MLNFVRTVCNHRTLSSVSNIVPKVCIIGSGPAGFYFAQHLIKVIIYILNKSPLNLLFTVDFKRYTKTGFEHGNTDNVCTHI